MGFDTDGTEWRTVAYTIFIEVMADNDEHALMFADVAFNDRTGANPGDFLAEIVDGGN